MLWYSGGQQRQPTRSTHMPPDSTLLAQRCPKILRLAADGNDWLAAVQETQRQRTGWPRLILKRRNGLEYDTMCGQLDLSPMHAHNLQPDWALLAEVRPKYLPKRRPAGAIGSPWYKQHADGQSNGSSVCPKGLTGSLFSERVKRRSRAEHLGSMPEPLSSMQPLQQRTR